jgi:N-methylhydantoinase B
MDRSPGLPDIAVQVRLEREAGGLIADFTGTSAQVAAPVNCVRSGPIAAVLYAALTLCGPQVPRNAGILRALSLVLPAGSVINARPPAAVNARMGVVRTATSAVLQALAAALPERMPAANSGMSFVLAFSGRGADGRPFVSTEIIAGGAGGGPDGPGAHGISTDVGNAMNLSAEALEGMVPVRLIAAERRRGSGGAGRHPGGDGIRRIYQALVDGVAVSLRGERFDTVPPGTAGGGAPLPSKAEVRRADGRIEVLASRSAPVLGRGDLLVVESCGGAGYGPPGEA